MIGQRGYEQGEVGDGVNVKSQTNIVSRNARWPGSV